MAVGLITTVKKSITVMPTVKKITVQNPLKEFKPLINNNPYQSFIDAKGTSNTQADLDSIQAAKGGTGAENSGTGSNTNPKGATNNNTMLLFAALAGAAFLYTSSNKKSKKR